MGACTSKFNVLEVVSRRDGSTKNKDIALPEVDDDESKPYLLKKNEGEKGSAENNGSSEQVAAAEANPQANGKPESGIQLAEDDDTAAGLNSESTPAEEQAQVVKSTANVEAEPQASQNKTDDNGDKPAEHQASPEQLADILEIEKPLEGISKPGEKPELVETENIIEETETPETQIPPPPPPSEKKSETEETKPAALEIEKKMPADEADDQPANADNGTATMESCERIEDECAVESLKSKSISDEKPETQETTKTPSDAAKA